MSRDVDLARRILKRASVPALVAGAAALASGCLLTSPTWNQSFDDHTDAIPLTAMTTTTTNPVAFECSPAYHGGLYPPFSPATWTAVASVSPTGGALDSGGVKLYTASGNYVLPSACWRQDPGNSVWYAAVRARQVGAAGPADGFFTVDAAGLACVGDWVGSSASWLGWLGKGCHTTYSGSSTAIPYVIIHATS